MGKRIFIIMMILSCSLMSSCYGILGGIIDGFDEPVDIDEQDYRLYRALSLDNLELVEEAIEAGADATVIKGKTKLNQIRKSPAFLFAMERANSDWILRCLMENGSDPNHIDDKGISLLMYTVGTPRGGVTHTNYFDPKYTQFLIDNGADVNQKGIHGYTALDCAILYGESRKCQRILLDAGVDISDETVKVQQQMLDENLEDRSDRQADADTFARSYYHDIVYEVFTGAKKKGVKVGLDPVIESLIMGDIDNANKIIETGDLADKNLNNFIYLATARGNADTLRALEKRFEGIYNLKDTEENLLFVSSANGNLDTTRYLVTKGFDVNDADYFDSILDFAVRNNHKDVVEYLLQQGARPSMTISEGEGDTSTLMYAIQADDGAELTRLIYENRQDDMNDYSVLKTMGMAVMYKKMDALKYLLEQTDRQKMSYETGLLAVACGEEQLAYSYKNLPFSWDNEMLDFVKLMVERGADVHEMVIDEEGEGYGDSLSVAVRNGNESIVKYLIEQGADVNAIDNLDDTPLKVAVSNGFFSIVKLLVENGAKIDNHKVDFGDYDNLLNFAEEYGGVRTYEYLKSVNGK